MTQLFGKETRDRLLNWDYGSTTAELLCSQVLTAEGYEGVDPQHPFGGPDGKKDSLCKKDGLRFVGGYYFPRGQQTFSEIETKFLSDFEGVSVNDADAFVFVTNQELKIGERKSLSNHGKEKPVQIIHLYRLANILNSPVNYGIRQEYLQIDMNREELVAFFKQMDIANLTRFDAVYQKMENASLKIDEATRRIEGFATGGDSFPFFSIRETQKKQHVFVRSAGDFPIYDLKCSARYMDWSLSKFIIAGKWDMSLSTEKFIVEFKGRNIDSVMNGSITKGLGIFESFAEKNFPLLLHFSAMTRNGHFDQYKIFDKTDKGLIRCSATLIIKGITPVYHWVLDQEAKNAMTYFGMSHGI